MPRKRKPTVFIEDDIQDGPGYMWGKFSYHPFDLLSTVLLVAAFLALAYALFVVMPAP
jgi:hypothetical protein